MVLNIRFHGEGGRDGIKLHTCGTFKDFLPADRQLVLESHFEGVGEVQVSQLADDPSCNLLLAIQTPVWRGRSS